MNELNLKGEIIISKEIKKEIDYHKNYLGTMLLKPGLKLFSYDFDTGEIEEVKIEFSEIYGESSKVYSKGNKVYLQFLNLKVAKKKFLKVLIRKSNERKSKLKYSKYAKQDKRYILPKR